MSDMNKTEVKLLIDNKILADFKQAISDKEGTFLVHKSKVVQTLMRNYTSNKNRKKDDPIRSKILYALWCNKGATTTDIAKVIDSNQVTILKHLKVMIEKNLVYKQKDPVRKVVYHLAYKGFSNRGLYHYRQKMEEQSGVD